VYFLNLESSGGEPWHFSQYNSLSSFAKIGAILGKILWKFWLGFMRVRVYMHHFRTIYSTLTCYFFFVKHKYIMDKFHGLEEYNVLLKELKVMWKLYLLEYYNFGRSTMFYMEIKSSSCMLLSLGRWTPHASPRHSPVLAYIFIAWFLFCWHVHNLLLARW
jgi:hypothetical protein